MELPLRYIRSCLSVVSCLCWLLICVSNSLLWFYLKDTKTKSSYFIKAILIVTIPIVTIELPFHALLLWDSSQLGFDVCIALNFTKYLLLLGSKLILVNIVAALCFTRYIGILQIKFGNIGSGYTMVVVILYSSVLIAPLTYDLYRHVVLADGEFICHANAGIKTKSDILGKKIYYVTLAAVTVGVTTASMTISITTILLHRYLVQHERGVAGIAMTRKAMNLKRITATQILWIVFSVFWVPYGILHGIKAVIPFEMFVVAVIVLETLSHVSFLVLPIVYYKMDGKYSQFIRKLIRRASASKYEKK